MLRFFRQIRQKLLENGNIRKYFWYALGEILLVMIGILLALQVNNWNEARKSEEAFKLILKDVQEDLYNDIVELSLALDWHIEQDSISTRIIEGRYSKEDFRDPNNEKFYTVGLAYYDIIISDRSFNLLSDFKDQIPLEYRDVIKRLNSLYIEDQSYLNRVQQNIIESSLAYKDFIYTNYDWTTPNPDWPDEEWVNYFMNSSMHKRKLYQYRSEVKRLVLYGTRMKDKAVVNYMIIRSIINDTNELPKFIQDYGITGASPSFDYRGRYVFTNQDGEDEIVEIINEYDLIFWKNYDDRSLFYFSDILLREASPDTLEVAGAPDYKVILQRDSLGLIHGLKTTFRDSLDQVYKLID